MSDHEHTSLKGALVLVVVLFWFFMLFLVSSQVLPRDPLDAIGDLVDEKRFNYVSWTLESLFNKAVSASVKAEKFMNDDLQTKLVAAYIDQTRQVEENEKTLNLIFNKPGEKPDPGELEEAKHAFDQANLRSSDMSLLVEAVIQSQTERTLSDMGFGTAGQIIPPVLYRVSNLPLNLIVSPRHIIDTAMSVSLKPALDTVEKDRIEDEIESSWNYSGLIEPVGGVGTYPSMVMRTSNIHWLTDTVAHEWTHNYLSLRPLGIRYFKDSAMRSINETTAGLSGVEVGRALIASFYPDLIQIGFVSLRERTWVPTDSEIDWLGFDFRREMHETRVKVDGLLETGEVESAEAYMEARRQVFWEAGYRIRKINQAYFAFYGSYSDTPGGASGEDPIGPAVRGLRYSFKRLKPFIDTIQGVRSFEDLMNRALAFGIIEQK